MPRKTVPKHDVSAIQSCIQSIEVSLGDLGRMFNSAAAVGGMDRRHVDFVAVHFELADDAIRSLHTAMELAGYTIDVEGGMAAFSGGGNKTPPPPPPPPPPPGGG